MITANNQQKLICAAVMTLLLILSGNIWGKQMKVAEPPPEVIDRVVHNKGNLATSVDNWGRIGGYSYSIGLPSGEWPRNSGHHYLAEIKYWMGAILPGGDTIVANSSDDFRPMQSLVQDEYTYDIRLNTDTSTYNYDPSDTVGAGLGNPAMGWRVYNADSSEWIYNRVYSAGDSTFHPAGPTGLQQSFFRFQDGNGLDNMGLEISHTMCQWNYCYNEDIIFAIVEITNNSFTDYTNFAFGIYCDFDIGGLNDAGGNGRLGDLVAFDQDENLAWTYDEDGYDPGWGPLVRTGVMGTKYLETPDDIGMTAFRTGQWDYLPENDEGRYDLINSGQYDVSLPPTDQYYIQCTRGIDLTAGKTVRVVYALIAGADEDDFYANAEMAQTLYDNYFVGPQPPEPPRLQVRAGDQKVYLSWGDTSEVSVDPLSGEQDFRGYKLYRSKDLGYTWGYENENNDNSCLTVDYLPIAAYGVDSAGEPISHSYVDTNLINGVEYWYCLAAYDNGDSSVPIDRLQNGFGIPDVDNHVVKVVPRADPAGHYSAESTIDHNYYGVDSASEGEVYPIIFDEAETLDEEYSVIFTETDYQTYWHLIRVDESGDTTYVLEDQTRQEGEMGLYNVAEGIRIVVRNGDRLPKSFAQTGFATEGDTTLHLGYSYGTLVNAFGWPLEYLGGDRNYRCTYEIRFTESGSIGYWIWDDVTPMNLPFEVWNTTLGHQVNAEIYDSDYDQIWEPASREYISILNIPYDGNPHPEGFPFLHTWFFRFDTLDAEYGAGDVFTIEGAPLNGADDVFTFKVDGVSSAAAKVNLENIRAVPDPYIGRAGIDEWEPSRFESKLQFVNLPDVCTIRIYTIAGDLVRTLHHSDGTGAEDWDMLSVDGLEIASGVYLFHVESKYGNHIGRFAVIN